MRKGKAHIGTSGWLYKHWRGTFYPKGLAHKEEFNYYSLFFTTVELNNPFYRLPSRETFETWRKNSKENFLYIVKASRFITHMKKLKDTKEALNIFLHNCNGLEEKLGPILFQLPPGWQLNIERFEEFLKQLPKGYRFAFEFRNTTWYTNEVYKLLKKYNCAFCIYQLAGHMSPIEVTTDWVYLRLHGPTKNKYQGSYDFKTLESWAEKAREWQKTGKDVYIYFDNDDSGYAVFNAQVIEMMLNKNVPITEQEATVLSLSIQAIKEKRLLTLEYETSKGKIEVKVAPHLLAIKNRGEGDIFLLGYQYPLTKSSKISSIIGERIELFLNKVNTKKIKILKETFEPVNFDEQDLFGDPQRVRTIYRVTNHKGNRSQVNK